MTTPNNIYVCVQECNRLIDYNDRKDLMTIWRGIIYRQSMDVQTWVKAESDIAKTILSTAVVAIMQDKEDAMEEAKIEKERVRQAVMQNKKEAKIKNKELREEVRRDKEQLRLDKEQVRLDKAMEKERLCEQVKLDKLTVKDRLREEKVAREQKILDTSRDACQEEHIFQMNKVIGTEGACNFLRHVKRYSLLHQREVLITTEIFNERFHGSFGSVVASADNSCNQSVAFDNFATRMRARRAELAKKKIYLLSEKVLSDLRIFMRFDAISDDSTIDPIHDNSTVEEPLFIDKDALSIVWSSNNVDSVERARNLHTLGCWLYDYDITRVPSELQDKPACPSIQRPSWDMIQHIRRSCPANDMSDTDKDVLALEMEWKKYEKNVHVWEIRNGKPANVGEINALTSPFCKECGALKLPGEVPVSRGATGKCCYGATVYLPPLPLLPIKLHKLYYAPLVRSGTEWNQHVYFKKHMKLLNHYHSFASQHLPDRIMPNGAHRQIVPEIFTGKGPPKYVIQGQVYAKAASIRNKSKNPARWAQIYVYDTSKQVTERILWMTGARKDLGIISDETKDVLDILSEVLAGNNPYASFISVAGKLMTSETAHVDLVLDDSIVKTYHAEGHAGVYQKPTAEMVGTILTDEGRIPGAGAMQHTIGPNVPNVRMKKGRDKRGENDFRTRLGDNAGPPTDVGYRNGHYDALLYPLLLPFGTHTWHPDILQREKTSDVAQERKTVTMQRAFCYRFHRRLHCNSDGHFARLNNDVDNKKRYFCYHVSNNQLCTVNFPCASCVQLLDDQTIDGRQPLPLQDDYLFRAQTLYQQYITHSFARTNLNSMNMIRTESMQRQFRRDDYQHVKKAVESRSTCDVTGKDLGKPSVLPSSVTGSQRSMHELFMDAMALMNRKGSPSLFLTMTMHPKDEKLLLSILNTTPGEKAHNAPDLVSRIFNELVKDLIEMVGVRHVFGECTGWTYSIEFQKRRLPHIHMLIILKNPPKMSPDFDRYVSAEIPPEFNTELRKIVATNNLHTCSLQCRDKNGMCKKHFPQKYTSFTHVPEESSRPIVRRRATTEKDGFSITTMRDNKKVEYTNADVVSYNAKSSMRYRCHLNIMPTTGWRSIKYIFKYVYKGPDRALATMQLTPEQLNRHNYRKADEVLQYLEGFFYGPEDSAWRFCELPTHGQSHSCMKLKIMDEDNPSFTFQSQMNADELFTLAEKSKQTHQLYCFFRLVQSETNYPLTKRELGYDNLGESQHSIHIPMYDVPLISLHFATTHWPL